MADEVSNMQDRLATTERIQQQTMAFMQRALQSPAALVEFLQRANAAGGLEAASEQIFGGPQRKRRLRQPLQLTASASQQRQQQQQQPAAGGSSRGAAASRGVRVEGLEDFQIEDYGAAEAPVILGGSGRPAALGAVQPARGSGASLVFPVAGYAAEDEGAATAAGSPLDHDMFLGAAAPRGFPGPFVPGASAGQRVASPLIDPAGLAWPELESFLSDHASAAMPSAGAAGAAAGASSGLPAGDPSSNDPLAGFLAAAAAAGNAVAAAAAGGPSAAGAKAGGASGASAGPAPLAPLSQTLSQALSDNAAAASAAAGGSAADAAGKAGTGGWSGEAEAGGLATALSGGSWLDRVEMDLLLSEMESLTPLPDELHPAAPPAQA